MWEAIASIASVQIKVMGTVVGNLCVGTPASDVAPALCALGARVIITGVDSSREVAIEEFFLDVGRTAVGLHEIVSEVVVPRPPSGSGGAFMKLAKTSEDIAKVNAAVFVAAANGVCIKARIALGSVAPIPVRATEGERLLVGLDLDGQTSVSDQTIADAAAAAMETAVPISDVRSTATYRKEMVRVLVREALELATTRAVGEGGRP